MLSPTLCRHGCDPAVAERLESVRQVRVRYRGEAIPKGGALEPTEALESPKTQPSRAREPAPNLRWDAQPGAAMSRLDTGERKRLAKVHGGGIRAFQWLCPSEVATERPGNAHKRSRRACTGTADAGQDQPVQG